jgi:histone deacetylase 11
MRLGGRFRVAQSKRARRVLIVLALAPLTSCSVPPKAVKEVKGPRPGHALNDRVAVVYSRHYQVGLLGFERLHPFDINKYVRIYVHLVRDGLLSPADVFVPTRISEQDILRVHTPEFLRSLRDPAAVARYLEASPLGIVAPKLLDLGIIEPFRYATGGTLLAARLALCYGIGINLGGGYHHARPNAGEGFCVYADMPIAIRTLQAEGLIRRALIVDLDVHQGNGTATCLANDASAFTFDMHQGNIYPIPKARCSLDVELNPGTGDEEYLRILSDHLPAVFRLSQPDIVFLQAGCDTLAGDGLASLKMTEQGIVRRDAMVVDLCVRHRFPVVMVLGGGYSPNAWHAQYASIRHIIQTYGTLISTSGSP